MHPIHPVINVSELECLTSRFGQVSTSPSADAGRCILVKLTLHSTDSMLQFVTMFCTRCHMNYTCCPYLVWFVTLVMFLRVDGQGGANSISICT